MRTTHFVAAAGVAAALACGTAKTSKAPPVTSSTPTASVADAPIPAPTGTRSATLSASPVATASATASSAVEPPPPEPITCKTEDDCWVDEHHAPVRRPKALRGKRPKACHGTEHTPTCEGGVCAVTAWKC
ncbi:MAG: hypothetical protein HOO96_06505 [Polyangiaceae bacterium]|nr:hypothetical protein [Polyangiaceae bacterium]